MKSRGATKVTALPLLPARPVPADPVDIIFNILRDIEVDHHIDVVHVNPAGSDIGCNQDIDLSLAEPAHHPVALRLFHIAVQFLGTVPPGLDLSGQFLCPALGVAEDDRQLGIPEIDHPAEHVEFLAVLDFDIGLFDLGNGQLGILDPDKLPACSGTVSRCR